MNNLAQLMHLVFYTKNCNDKVIIILEHFASIVTVKDIHLIEVCIKNFEDLLFSSYCTAKYAASP